MGDLAATPAPMLILGLRREGFTGVLALEREAERMRLRLGAGLLLQAESSQAEHGLTARLVQDGSLSDAEALRVGEAVAGGQRELTAVAGLRKLGPRVLVAALQAQARACLLEACSWSQGRFSLEPGTTEAGAAGIPSVDPTGVVLEALAQRRPHELLEALGDRAAAHPRTETGLDEISKLMPRDGLPHGLLERLDGRSPAFALVEGDCASSSGAALLVLDGLGLLTWGATPLAPLQTAEPELACEPEGAPLLDIEIRDADEGPGGASPAARASASVAVAGQDAAVDAIRAELHDLQTRLAELDHYTLLGLDRDAKPAQVKRAYLKLAKRLHPDAIAQRGLSDLKQSATQVFAQITRAHTTLGDPLQRQQYDASLDGHVIEDADRVAQAEMLYRKGEILMRAGNFSGALEFLAPAVELWAEEADYQGALGWCLFRKNPPDVERARTHLEHALRLAPDAPVWRERLDTLGPPEGG